MVPGFRSLCVGGLVSVALAADRKRLDLIKRARAVGDRCNDLGKQIPLNHVAIHQAYDELRQLTWDVEALSLHQLHTT